MNVDGIMDERMLEYLVRGLDKVSGLKDTMTTAVRTSYVAT